MTPKLTPEQREAIQQADGPVPVEDGETKQIYFLVDESTINAMRRQEDLSAIREGIADMEAGRVVTLDELDARIRTRLWFADNEMTFTIVTTERAAREIEDVAAWWAQKHSVEQADRWYRGMRSAIAGLATSPERHPIAAEANVLPYEIRELHYGLGSKTTHRVVFTIVRETVLVLTVRHGSRHPLRPEDLMLD